MSVRGGGHLTEGGGVCLGGVQRTVMTKRCAPGMPVVVVRHDADVVKVPVGGHVTLVT